MTSSKTEILGYANLVSLIFDKTLSRLFYFYRNRKTNERIQYYVKLKLQIKLNYYLHGNILCMN